MFLKNQYLQIDSPINFNFETKEGIRLGFSQRDLNHEEEEEEEEDEEEETTIEEEMESENRKTIKLHYDVNVLK